LNSTSEENVYLVMGCYGRKESGFVLCPSIQNRILKLDESLVNYDGIMDYLDAVKLFDRPMIDQNAVRNFIYNLQNKFDQKIRRLWTDHEYHLIERFIIMHKNCGIYCQLILVSEELDDEEDDQISFVIRGTPQREEIYKPPNLKVVRGRKYK
jgi:hypothetical protein